MGNYNKKLFDRFMAGIAAVNVKTQDEYNQFMQLLEKETNLKWRLGQKPTQLDMFTPHREKTCIDRVVGRYMIRYSDISYYDSNGYEIIEFSDLMKEGNNMKFKVGDKVRVRSWESMKKEFENDKYGGVNCYYNFTPKMKKFCETVHTIKSVNKEFKYYYLEDGAYYRFSGDMLEPVKAETNGQHFRKELSELKGHAVAVVNGEPTKCDWDIRCYKCLFHGRHACIEEFKKWCAEPYEAQEDKPILDKIEHDYLASVIAPKRIYDNVKYILKIKVAYNKYYICIGYENENICLPYFREKDHMYEGMEQNREYTLKELGLEKE